MSLLTIILFFTAAVMLMRPPTNPPTHQLTKPSIGSLAPDFTLTDYNGKAYRLSNFRGKKVLLNFFCGCGKCFQLAPEWEKIHRQNREVQVLGVSTIHPESVHGWCRAAGVTFPVLFDPGYEVAQRYGSTDCPRSWVIHSEGKVVYVSPQGASPATIADGLEKGLRHKGGRIDG